MANPYSLTPYHTILGPAAGPTCCKILAPPLSMCNIAAAAVRKSSLCWVRVWMHRRP